MTGLLHRKTAGPWEAFPGRPVSSCMHNKDTHTNSIVPHNCPAHKVQILFVSFYAAKNSKYRFVCLFAMDWYTLGNLSGRMELFMYLRRYRPEDCPSMAALFFDTVHTVNARDYTPAQLDAWADGTLTLPPGTADSDGS